MRREWDSAQRCLATAARHFAADTSGATAIEYALLLTLIIVAIFAAIGQVSSALNGMFAQLTAFFSG